MTFETENAVATVYLTREERDLLVSELKKQAAYAADPERGLGPDYAKAAAFESRWNQLDQVQYFQRMPSAAP